MADLSNESKLSVTGTESCSDEIFAEIRVQKMPRLPKKLELMLINVEHTEYNVIFRSFSVRKTVGKFMLAVFDGVLQASHISLSSLSSF